MDLIEEGRVSAGHGRALLGISDAKIPSGAGAARLARRAHGATDRAPGGAPQPRAAGTAGSRRWIANTRSALEQLQQALGTRVTLRPATKTRPGQLQIEYYDEEQLAGLYDRLTRAVILPT